MPTDRDHIPRLPMTRRLYLTLKTMDATGAAALVALESVANVAVGHPEWDMGEERTWAEWEAVQP